VGLNAAPEPSSANRSKGSTPFSADKNLARQLGIPETWMQAFTDWHLSQKGMDANLLPKDYQLKGGQVVDSATGYSDPNAEIAKNQAKYESDKKLIDVVEGYKEQGIIPPETTVIGDKADIQSIDDIKKYSSARRAIGGDFEIVNGNVVKASRKTPQYQILQIYKNINNASNLIPTPVRKFAKGAAATGIVGLGLIDDVSASVKPFVTDYDGDEEQRKLDEIKAAAGMTGLYATFTGNVPAASMSMLAWSAATYKSWALGKDKSRIADLELSLGIRESDRDRTENDVLGQGPVKKLTRRGLR
jgi:hypothetical protein